jgi:hypothetical protein
MAGRTLSIGPGGAISDDDLLLMTMPIPLSKMSNDLLD